MITNNYVTPSGYLKMVYLGKTISGKTAIYRVYNQNEVRLGIIQWFSNWRRYTFIPTISCIFDKSCLLEIGNFLDKLMGDHKKELEHAPSK